MRSGSQTIKDKNVKEIGGRPLYEWFLESAIESKIDEIYLAIDSPIYENMIRDSFLSQLHKLNFYYRDPENAKDNSTTESVILEFIQTKRNQLESSDVFMLGQVTNPFIMSEDINEMLNIFINDDRYESMLSVANLEGRFLWKQDKQSNGIPINYDYNKRHLRQQINGEKQKYFMENGGLYVSYVQNIELTKNRLCPPVGLYVMEHHTHYELDEKEDYIVIDALLRYGKR